MKIAIIGSGVYGCYLYNLLKTNKKHDIKIFEAGSSYIKDESSMPINSITNGYRGTSEGRYFGLGGTSSKWGGQILFYDEFDYTNDKSWNHFVDLNIKYKERICKRLQIKPPNPTIKNLRF